MKLIAEFNDQSLNCVITEGKDNKEKSYVIEGVFAQAEKKNRNGRIYSLSVMENAVNKYYTEQVATGRAVGELNHPEGPTVNLDKVSHLITDLRFEGNNVIGKAKILDTPMGKIVKGLLDGGVQLGVSTRGMGSIEERNGGTYIMGYTISMSCSVLAGMTTLLSAWTFVDKGLPSSSGTITCASH